MTDDTEELARIQSRLLEARARYREAMALADAHLHTGEELAAMLRARFFARLEEHSHARAAEVARLRASFRLVPSTAPDEHEAPRAVAPPAPVVFEGDQLCELRGFTAAVALARLLRPELTPQALAAAGRVRQPGWSRTVTVATAETVIAWAEHECPELQHGPARSG